MPGYVTPPGIAPATLQANLSAAQTALDQLLRGSQTQQVSYGEGNGQRSVTYNRSSIGELRKYIEDLQTQLGYRARRAIGVRF
jgi:hypothetical protein